jgi:predicted enzyme related to lactoylglutathione lyase
MTDETPDWERPVCFFEIRGRDPKRLREFYVEMFNWKVTVNDAINYAIVQPGVGPPENGIGGGITAGDVPGVSLYIQVRDLRASLEKAERLGGKTTRDPFDVPNSPTTVATLAQIADPEGNLVGLVQQ